jgi:hypothetical protein
MLLLPHAVGSKRSRRRSDNKRSVMRKTKPVVYGHQGFWGYDVAVGILLKYLIDAAQVSAEANTPWLSEAISDWRVQAVISDF